MGHKNLITLGEYYEYNFDVPLKGRDDHLMSKDSLCISQPAFIPVDVADLVRIEDIVLSRGAVRGKDYIISCHANELAIAVLTIHTTDKFLSRDDFIVDADGNIYVTG